jgi:dihydropteroate synthase
MFTLNCRGRLLCLEEPVVMGILNVTPDSFFAGSRIEDEKSLVKQASKMIQEGATMLDIGGQSTRPGSEKIQMEEELKRVLPAIQTIRKTFPDIFISVDTYYAEVARQAAAEGADIINDISAGLLDPDMGRIVGAAGIPYIMMHMKGNPQNMQGQMDYHELMPDILRYFTERMEYMKQYGIKDIIIDPGFGFAKTIEQNFEMLSALHQLHILDKPVLVGFSRKSMIWKTLQTTPENSLNGTTVLNTIALMKRCHILRVHDVKEAVECIKLTTMAL